ncbi:MAG: thioesterase family protein [Pirellulales bacterium]|nr:thioesterase family protein [Pirellulales bacterium]
MPPVVPRSHQLEIRVRYQETDGQGRLHHANYLTYFELGRTELLRSAGYTYREFEETGLMLVVAEMHIQYFRPAVYDDLLLLTTSVIQSKGARIRHAYELRRGVELLAKGESMIACVDRTGRVRRLPEWLLEPETNGDSRELIQRNNETV